MKTSERGIELIASHEGLMLKAYKCPAGVVTIGYGHTRTAKQGMSITKAKADELLRSDVKSAESCVSSLSTRLSCPLNQNQFDALVSFVFNIGSGAFLKSTLRKKIVVCPNDPSIAQEFSKWVYASGKRLAGLVKRRKDESELYFNK